MKSDDTFCCFQYQAVQKGNQHNSHDYDDIKIGLIWLAVEHKILRIQNEPCDHKDFEL